MARVYWIVSGRCACHAVKGNRAAKIRVNAQRVFVLRVYDGGTEYPPYRRYESLACAKKAGSKWLREVCWLEELGIACSCVLCKRGG